MVNPKTSFNLHTLISKKFFKTKAMSDKNTIKLIQNLLQDRGKWFIEAQAPDIPEVEDICQKAREGADALLPELSTSALYNRYLRWRKQDLELPLDIDLFRVFLDQVAFDLGMESLNKEEKLIF